MARNPARHTDYHHNGLGLDMTGTTARLKIPYPQGTDRVMDGDNAMQTIAETLDGQAVGFVASSAGLVIPTASFTGLACTSLANVGGGYNQTTGGFTVPVTGIYAVSGVIVWPNNTVGANRLLAGFHKIGAGANAEFVRASAPILAGQQGVSIGYHYKFTAGDVLQFAAYHDAGGNLGLVTTVIGASLVVPMP